MTRSIGIAGLAAILAVNACSAGTSSSGASGGAAAAAGTADHGGSGSPSAGGSTSLGGQGPSSGGGVVSSGGFASGGASNTSGGANGGSSAMGGAASGSSSGGGLGLGGAAGDGSSSGRSGGGSHAGGLGAGGAGAAGGAAGALATGGVAGATSTGGSAGSGDFVEDHRAQCTIAAMPAVSALKDVAFLPDPFTTLGGTPVTTREQWKCRREELAAMLEHYELGEKPRNPEKVTGSMSGNTLSISVTDKGKSITFTVAISKPAGTGPFPAVIGFGGGSLGSSLSGLSVATINYTAADIFNASAPNQMAKDGSSYRGQGLFYDLYGSAHGAGAMMAWAWGVSRIIDALMVTPAAGIDPKRLGVTGCSRFGKGAFVAGAFDERVALTIPQEGGSGGCSAWRGIAYVKSTGSDIEQLSNVAGGTNWFRSSFSSSFSNSTIDKIPYDHHELTGLVAPRGLLNIENSGIAWLGGGATHINNVGGREIFVALGAPEAHTYSLSTSHDHCVLPSSQNHWVQSYAKKYLLGQSGEESKIEAPAGYTVERAKWINWTTPSLK